MPTCQDPQIDLKFDLLNGPDFHECQHWQCKRVKAESDRKLAEESDKAWRTALYEEIMSSGEGRRRLCGKPQRPFLRSLPSAPSSLSQDSKTPYFITPIYTEKWQQPQPTMIKARALCQEDVRYPDTGQMLNTSPSSSKDMSSSESSTLSRNTSCSTDEGANAIKAEQPKCSTIISASSTQASSCSAVKLFDGTVDHKLTVTPTGCFTAEMATAGIWWEQRFENRRITVVDLRALARYAATLDALVPRRSSCPVLYSSQEYDYKTQRFRQGADPATSCQRTECGHLVSTKPIR